MQTLRQKCIPYVVQLLISIVEVTQDYKVVLDLVAELANEVWLRSGKGAG